MYRYLRRAGDAHLPYQEGSVRPATPTLTEETSSWSLIGAHAALTGEDKCQQEPYPPA